MSDWQVVKRKNQEGTSGTRAPGLYPPWWSVPRRRSKLSRHLKRAPASQKSAINPWIGQFSHLEALQNHMVPGLGQAPEAIGGS